MSLHTCNFVVNAFSSVQFSAVAKAQWKRVCWYNRCIYIHMMHVNSVAWIEFDSVSVFHSLFRFCELCKHRFEFAPSKSLSPSLSLSLSSSLHVLLPSLSHLLLSFVAPLFQFSLSPWHASASPPLRHCWWNHLGHDQQSSSLVSPRLCGLHVAHPCTHMHMWVSSTLHL